MSIVYATPIISDFVTISGSAAQVRQDFLDGVETALTDAGWTATDVYPTSVFTFNGVLPSNGHNLVVGGKTYTWQTVLTNSDGNVLIGSNATDCLTNIIAAVNLGSGAGTIYAAATTANTVAQVSAANTLQIRATGLGPSPYTNLGATVSINGAQSGAYGSWSSGSLVGAGQSFLSPENSDDFGQFRLITRINALATAQNIFIDLATRDGAQVITDAAIFGGNVSDSPGLVSGNTYRMLASPASLDIFLPGTYNSDGTFCKFNAPAIPSFLRGLKISGATNATPVVYTTVGNHGYTTGDVVFCRYAGGNDGANTQGAITVISPTTFSITGSVGTGAYTSGGIVWNETRGQVGETSVLSGSASNGSIATWRSTLEKNRCAWIINGVALNGGTSGRPSLQFLTNGNETPTAAANVWFNNNNFAIEPFVSLGTSGASVARLVGQLRNCAIFQVSTTGDTVPDPFDGHTWIAITNAYAGSSTQAAGTIVTATS